MCIASGPCSLAYQLLPNHWHFVLRPTANGGMSGFLRWLARPEPDPKLLSRWLMPRLPGWACRVNEPLSYNELEAVRWSIKRGSPFGEATWVESTARRLALQTTLRPRGRPGKQKSSGKGIKES